MPSRIAHHDVLVGIDGSPSSTCAVRWAVREAMMRNVLLAAVHVAATSSVGSVPARTIIADATKLVEDSAEAGDRPEINGEVVFGGPVPTPVDVSEEAQLVVVGCRGRSALRRGLLGSVCTGLIHHAHCPVVVVHDEVAASPQTAQLPVLVGVDGSPAS